mmetsp:Transcript_8640/g.11440  ORF Transcript_8640/g.11440 Transcript_8640/m.11440 type:complete len:447 (+) Transcript_8640:53-1393(+)
MQRLTSEMKLLPLLICFIIRRALPIAAEDANNAASDSAIGKKESEKEQIPPFMTEQDISRDLCGFDPPKSYCGFCDNYYRQHNSNGEGTCDNKECTYQCSDQVRCSSDPSHYCPGYCCKDFGCTIFGCREKKCDYNSVGCNGICCERRDEVSQDFWEKAEEKAAKWFIKRASKFFVGGCGLPCQAFIQFLFAPRPPDTIMSVDCWKLPNQTDVPRTAPRNSDEYPILGDTLVTSDVDLDAAEHRRETYNVIANKTRQELWGGSPGLESAFAFKLKIPELHSDFVRSSKGGVSSVAEWAKLLYDEFSGCTDCCDCAINKVACLQKCSNRVRILFNYNIEGYEWPDWSYDENEHVEMRYSYINSNTPMGYHYNNSLLFEKVDFSDAEGSGDAVATLPKFEKQTYDGVFVGCHIYPHAWRTTSASSSSFLLYFSGTLCCFSSLLLGILF